MKNALAGTSIDDIGAVYEEGPEQEVSKTPAPAPAAPAPGGTPVTLTFEQLKDLLIEAKKPVISDSDKKKLENDQQTRLDNAAIITLERAKKLQEQAMCGHIRRDGSSRTVYVENGNYLICQRCQDVIRPNAMLKDKNGKDMDKPDIARRELFQKHFAMVGRSQLFDY
jgi:RNA polymerase-binding transcription factor DksA